MVGAEVGNAVVDPEVARLVQEEVGLQVLVPGNEVVADLVVVAVAAVVA